LRNQPSRRWRPALAFARITRNGRQLRVRMTADPLVAGRTLRLRIAERTRAGRRVRHASRSLTAAADFRARIRAPRRGRRRDLTLASPAFAAGDVSVPPARTTARFARGRRAVP
jgi:hypothetical protein